MPSRRHRTGWAIPFDAVRGATWQRRSRFGEDLYYRAVQHRIGRCENVLVAEPGARPRQQRGGPLEPQRLVLEEPRQPFSGGGIESAQTQVLADALLMLRDRLPSAGVGVDRLGVGAQSAGPRTSGSPRRSPRVRRDWGGEGGSRCDEVSEALLIRDCPRSPRRAPRPLRRTNGAPRGPQAGWCRGRRR